jgi:hypothetical protein
MQRIRESQKAAKDEIRIRMGAELPEKGKMSLAG